MVGPGTEGCEAGSPHPSTLSTWPSSSTRRSAPFSARCWMQAWEQDEQHRGQQPRLLLQGLRHRDCVISSLSRTVAPPQVWAWSGCPYKQAVCPSIAPRVGGPGPLAPNSLKGSVLEGDSRGCPYQGAEARWGHSS